MKGLCALEGLSVASFVLAVFLFGASVAQAAGEEALAVTCPETGARVEAMTEQVSPMVRLLLPGQAGSERGVIVEFPEVVQLRKDGAAPERVFVVDRRKKESAPDTKIPEFRWALENKALTYSMDIGRGISMKAVALPESDGVRLRLTFSNSSDESYDAVMPVTCVQLGYDAPFGDRRLDRTYVHHAEGFELVASETPERLTEPLEDYVQSRTDAMRRVPANLPPAEKCVDPNFARGYFMRYHKQKPIDDPVIATTSADGQWIAATYNPAAQAVWSNPDWTCHHSDPVAPLPAHGAAALEVKLFVFRGAIEDLPPKLAAEKAQAAIP